MSRSGEIFRPWRTMSSPVLTMMVNSAGSITSNRPRRSFEAPTPPARAVIFRDGFMVGAVARLSGGKAAALRGSGQATAALPKGRGEARPLHSVSSIERQEIHFRADVWRKKFFLREEFGVDGEAFAEEEAAGFGFGLQPGNLRPSSFGIDEIFGDGRDSAPIVDAGIEQTREIVVAQIWRGLDVHLRAEDEARESDGAQHIFK